MLLGGWFWLCSAIVMGAAIATFLGFLGSLAWSLALLEHLRPHYVLSIGAASLFLWFWRSERTLAKPILFIGLIALSINLSLLLPLIFHNSLIPLLDRSASPPVPHLSILHFNLDRENRQRDRVINYLNQQRVDLLLLQEITPEWLEKIEQDLTHYDIVTAFPQSNSQGSALLKRRTEIKAPQTPKLDIIRTQVNAFPEQSTRLMLSAEVKWNDQMMSILSLHVTRPRNASTSDFQKTELEAIAKWSQATQTPTHSVIIVGDFNSTPWSQGFRTFQHQSDLILAQQGWGLKPTWPAQLPAFLQIPIDCCLHSTTLTTVRYQVGPNLGSDHRPITVQLR